MNINTSYPLSAYFSEPVLSIESYGNGLINDTFLVCLPNTRYILQRVNCSVFPNPVFVMENILSVTGHIREKYKGADAERCTLQVLPTLEGKPYYTDPEGGFWRLYAFVEGTVTLEQVENKEQFYSCGKAFGAFQGMLSDFSADSLKDPLPGLHDTPDRYRKLQKAMAEDLVGRGHEVREEYDFLCRYAEFYHILQNANLPLRVTHNDTKLNNILFDSESGEAVCVIDLDTVMSGYAATDFGDAIRAGASRDGVLDLSLYEVFAKGFLQGCEGRLCEKEIDLLAESALLITLELAMRFLADYLQGDTYFKIKYPTHNLDRAREQIALAKDMQSKLAQMKQIVHQLRKADLA